MEDIAMSKNKRGNGGKEKKSQIVNLRIFPDAEKMVNPKQINKIMRRAAQGWAERGGGGQMICFTGKANKKIPANCELFVCCVGPKAPGRNEYAKLRLENARPMSIWFMARADIEHPQLPEGIRDLFRSALTLTFPESGKVAIA
jgi:hypothetical protein